MDLRKIKKLIELLEDSALSEMEISEGDNTIRLSRAAPAATVAPVPVAPVPVASPMSTPATLEAVDSAPADAAVAESTVSKGQTVVSPLVGTFYDAPSPEAAAFVTVGQTVNIGDTLCLIEAMKTFNHIDADVAGVVVAVHKKNGEPVEYGEALFVIDGEGDA